MRECEPFVGTMRAMRYFVAACSQGAITTKINHAIKHKTSPTRLAQLLQPSLAFCFSLQPMAAYWTVQNANEGCNSCASLAGLVLCFIACFILLVIAPLPFKCRYAECADLHITCWDAYVMAVCHPD